MPLKSPWQILLVVVVVVGSSPRVLSFQAQGVLRPSPPAVRPPTGPRPANGQSLKSACESSMPSPPPLFSPQHSRETKVPYGRLLPRGVPGTCTRLWTRNELLLSQGFSCLQIATTAEFSLAWLASIKGKPFVRTVALPETPCTLLRLPDYPDLESLTLSTSPPSPAIRTPDY